MVTHLGVFQRDCTEPLIKRLNVDTAEKKLYYTDDVLTCSFHNTFLRDPDDRICISLLQFQVLCEMLI